MCCRRCLLTSGCAASSTSRACLFELQGNRAGVVGCGFWNNNCGGLDVALVWEIVYCIIAGLIVVVFPFFIFYYENDDEGMSAEEESGGSFIGRCCNFGNFKRSLGVAICYTVATAALAALVVFLMYNYLKQTSIPYKLTSIGVGTVAFRPGMCHACVMPRGACCIACLQQCAHVCCAVFLLSRRSRLSPSCSRHRRGFHVRR